MTRWERGGQRTSKPEPPLPSREEEKGAEAVLDRDGAEQPTNVKGMLMAVLLLLAPAMPAQLSVGQLTDVCSGQPK